MVSVVFILLSSTLIGLAIIFDWTLYNQYIFVLEIVIRDFMPFVLILHYNNYVGPEALKICINSKVPGEDNNDWDKFTLICAKCIMLININQTIYLFMVFFMDIFIAFFNENDYLLQMLKTNMIIVWYCFSVTTPEKKSAIKDWQRLKFFVWFLTSRNAFY